MIVHNEIVFKSIKQLFIVLHWYRKNGIVFLVILYIYIYIYNATSKEAKPADEVEVNIRTRNGVTHMVVTKVEGAA